MRDAVRSMRVQGTVVTAVETVGMVREDEDLRLRQVPAPSPDRQTSAMLIELTRDGGRAPVDGDCRAETADNIAGDSDHRLQDRRIR